MQADESPRRQPDPLADELTLSLLKSTGGRRLLEMSELEMNTFLTSAESSLSVRATDDPALKATIEGARAETSRRRVDLLLEGPGVTAIALAGALVFLDESGYVVQNCGGSSGGAMVAALEASGYTPGEIRDKLLSTDFRLMRERTFGERLSRRDDRYSGELFEAWLGDLLAAKGVTTFADFTPPTGMQESASVKALRGRLAGDVAGRGIVSQLLLTHPSYAGGRAASFEIPPPSETATMQPFDVWVSTVTALYRSDPGILLDTRRLICGLAYIDDDVFRAISQGGFLNEIEAEISGGERELNEIGWKLREARRAGSSEPFDLSLLRSRSALLITPLQLLVSDLSEGEPRQLVLPRQADVLGVRGEELPVASVVRMSISLEPAFEPYVWLNPVTGREKRLGDGTIASNFPVSLFDVEDAPPLWPTFGVRAVDTNAPPDRVDVNDALRTIGVPTLGLAGTEFDIERSEALRLYEAGHEACRDFLASWNFERYLSRSAREVADSHGAP